MSYRAELKGINAQQKQVIDAKRAARMEQDLEIMAWIEKVSGVA